MKKMLLCAIIVGMIVLVFSRCKDENECIEPIALSSPFLLESNCEYKFSIPNSEESIRISLDSIADLRAYGVRCGYTWGGNATIYLSINTESASFSWRGCDGFSEYPMDLPTLPKYEIDGYKVIMMKMYPLSEEQEAKPVNIGDYKIKLAIVKK